MTTDGVRHTFQTSKEPTTPQKLQRERYSSLASDTSPSRMSMRRALQSPNSPPRLSHAKQVPTMRKHQTRMSEDLRTASVRSIVDDNEDDGLPNSNNDAGTRQAVRGGSMETSLGTRLIGGSLRAAGLNFKSSNVFPEPDGSSTTARRSDSRQCCLSACLRSWDALWPSAETINVHGRLSPSQRGFTPAQDGTPWPPHVQVHVCA